MAGNPMESPGKQAGQEIWQRSGVLPWGLGAALVILAWIEVQRKPAVQLAPAGAALAMLILHALLVLTLERAFSYLPVGEKRRYRLAFLVSMALPAAYWLAQGVVWLLAAAPVARAASPLMVFVLHLGIAFLGAFGGGLAATGVREGLWENNSPPPDQVKEEVYRLHREQIGNPEATPFGKRCFDVALALAGLLLSAPVWLASAFLVWFEDPGPVLFVKNSTGKGGANFHQFKLRTMVCGAEENTGPILSQEGDQRVLLAGGLLRKTALDELPQLINILRGEMSFVGPRPQRTVLVQEYLQSMPEYAERHRVLPGLAGLAQVAGHYYLTPRQKLRFDRLYIRYCSLGFDIKLIWLACMIAFWLRWRKGWDGRLPRRWLRLGNGRASG